MKFFSRLWYGYVRETNETFRVYSQRGLVNALRCYVRTNPIKVKYTGKPVLRYSMPTQYPTAITFDQHVARGHRGDYLMIGASQPQKSAA